MDIRKIQQLILQTLRENKEYSPDPTWLNDLLMSLYTDNPDMEKTQKALDNLVTGELIEVQYSIFSEDILSASITRLGELHLEKFGSP
jgi:hypothetical protein